MMALKNHVKYRAMPKASIAHGYLMEETMEFVTSYLKNYRVMTRQVWDANSKDFDNYKILQGAGKEYRLTLAERMEGHKYVV